MFEIKYITFAIHFICFIKYDVSLVMTKVTDTRRQLMNKHIYIIVIGFWRFFIKEVCTKAEHFAFWASYPHNSLGV